MKRYDFRFNKVVARAVTFKNKFFFNINLTNRYFTLFVTIDGNDNYFI